MASTPADPPPTRATLQTLLGALIERPDRLSEIEATIDRVFGGERAVLALDMSGFSRTTQAHGITAFLLMIHQMTLLACPAIAARGGTLIKNEGDNLFCVFPSAAAAVDAAREIVERLETVNVLLPEAKRLYAAIGIGFGRVLIIEDEDLFGDEVNLASKLGEDIAGKGAILLTPSARAALGDDVKTEEAALSISGLSLVYHALS